jgi:hypothetical protein
MDDGGSMTDSLLSRLQSLTAPSREVDAEIALANGWQTTFARTVWMNPDKHLDHDPPRYTESLDAALMLAPEAMTWTVSKWFNHSGDGDTAYYWADLHCAPDEHWSAHHKLPSVSLLIAIMKAKKENKS